MKRRDDGDDYDEEIIEVKDTKDSMKEGRKDVKDTEDMVKKKGLKMCRILGVEEMKKCEENERQSEG